MPETEQDLDTRIELECGLALRKVEETQVIGSNSTKYSAKLSFNPIGALGNIPPGISSPQLSDITVTLDEEVYNFLLEQRGDSGSAYGKVTIELYSRTAKD